MAVKDKTGAQSQVCLSVGPQQGGQPSRLRTATRVYAITQQQAQVTPEVVTTILLVSKEDARILIDPGATYSFVAK